MTIVRYHIQRGGLYLAYDMLWYVWGDPAVRTFSYYDNAVYWQSRFDGSCIRVSVNGVLVREEGDLIAAERERCAKICDAEAEAWLHKIPGIMGRGGLVFECQEHARIARDLASKIRRGGE